MDCSGSGWSSGCESGWTVYLHETSSHSSNRYGRRTTADVLESYRTDKKLIEEEEEEDLSMVSDASSGPPPHNNINGDKDEDYINVAEDETDNCCGVYTRPQVEVSSSKKKKGGAERRKKSDSKAQIPYKCTDDTASSPPLMIYSKSYPHMRCQGNSSAFDNHNNNNHELGFWRSSNPQNPDSAETSSRLRGRRRRD